jgi:hypothetical protein
MRHRQDSENRPNRCRFCKNVAVTDSVLEIVAITNTTFLSVAIANI